MGMCGTLMILGLCLGIFNFGKPEVRLYASLQIIYALFSGYLFILAMKNRHTLWQTHLYSYSLAFLVLLGIYLAKLESFLLTWAFTLPIIFYLLLGRKAGKLITLAMMLSIMVILYPKLLSFRPVMTNFAFSYLLIWAISHIYESNRESAELALHKLALTDPLTGTNNRLSLQARFNQSTLVSEHKPLTLLLLDVDHFKQVNDNFGHVAGDDVLKSIANLLTKYTDDLDLFRIGGEEFCIFLHDSSTQESLTLAQTLRANVERETFISEGLKIQATISIGVTLFKEGMQLCDLLRSADEQLYRAKLSGRNRVMHNLVPAIEDEVMAQTAPLVT